MSLLTSGRILRKTAFAILFCVLACFLCTSSLPAQHRSADAEQERLTANRFLKVLLKRPRPGTSLDQVYGFHVRDGSLDDFLMALQTPSDQVAEKISLANADPGASLMVLGLIQLQRGRSSAAVTALKKAEKIRPSDAICSFYLGRAYLAISENKLATDAMERAIQRGPSRNEALPIFTELGRIYGRAGASKKALNVWNRLEQQFPGDNRVAGQIANTLAENGDLKEALRRFELLAGAARKDDDKVAFAIQAAEMKHRLGQAKQATTDLEKLLSKLRPGSWLHTDVLNRIEDGFLKSGQINALADYYQQRLNQDTDNLELMIRLGRVLVSAGQLEDAETTLNNAVKRAPEDVNVRLTLVDILVRQNHVSAAAAQYQQLAKQDPSNPDYLLKWGQLLLEDQSAKFVDRRASAAKIWKQLAVVRSEDAVTLAQVADRMRSIDRPNDAIALYRKASALDPTATQYREYLGEYLHQLKRNDEAIVVWESIAEGDRRNAETVIRLAEIYHTFKLQERCLDTWQAASEFSFTFHQELRYINRLRAARQFDAAIERLSIASQIADTADEREQLLAERITTYSEAGTLPQRIAALQAIADPSIDLLRELALMHQANGQLVKASTTITAALHQAPENIAALSLAADILERQNQLANAATYYQKLAKTDRRFQTKHLEKVAHLQIRLGQAEQALQTCDQLIQANPASIDSYLFTARTAFQLRSSEKGIEVLRRAMSVARRDTRPRLLLATELASQYRTEDAIDLYWQALALEGKLDHRIDIIRSLIPLYQRQDETQKLLSRIESLELQNNDIRATQLMLAAANETLKDYRTARQAIERLLSRQPRDLVLLEAMVRLSLLSKDVATAAAFQQKVVDVADSAENRFRLLNLQFDAGIIDINTMVSERIASTHDLSALIEMLQRAAKKGDSTTAILIARRALKRDETLWNIKLMLASLLTANNNSENEVEANRLCNEILLLKLPPETPAPTSMSSLTPVAVTHVTDWNSRLRHVITHLNQSANQFQYQPSNSFGGGRAIGGVATQVRNLGALKVGSYGEATIAAIGLQWKIGSRRMTPDKREAWMLSEIAKQHALPKDLQQVTTAWKIIKYQTLAKLVASFKHQSRYSTSNLLSSNSSRGVQIIQNGRPVMITPFPLPSHASPQPASAPSISPVAWRLFELSPAEGWTPISNHCMQRLVHHHRIQQVNSKADQPTADRTQSAANQPLTEAQLLLLESQFDQLVADQITSGSNSFQQIYSLASQLQYEFALAENKTAVLDYAAHTNLSKASYQHMKHAINFHITIGDWNSMDALMARLTVALREEITRNAEQRKPVSVGSHSALNLFTPTHVRKKYRPQLLDNRIALFSYHQSIAATSQTSSASAPSSRLSPSTYSGQSSAPLPLIPFTSSLFDVNLVSELNSLYPEFRPAQAITRSRRLPAYTVQPRRQSMTREPEFDIQQLTEELNKPRKDIPSYEVKSRRSLAAFIYLWNKEPEKCFQILQQLSDDFSTDSAIRIELARIARLMQKHKEVIAILDDIEPLAPQLQLQKDLLLLNSAIALQEKGLSRQVANRLVETPMTWFTANDVSKKLSKNGLTPQAISILKSAPRGAGTGQIQQIQIAQALHRLGEKETSVEIAATMLKQHIHHPPKLHSRAHYGLAQAVEILSKTNQLLPLIEEAKQQVTAASNTQQAVEQLFHFYEVVGMTKELVDFQNEMATQNIGLSVSSQIKFGKRLLGKGEYEAAGALLLMACKAEPDRIASHSGELQTVARAGYRQQVLEGLKTIPLNQISETFIKDLLNVNQRLNSKTFTYTDVSDTERAFIVHLLKSEKDVSWALRLMNTLPKEERRQLPEFRSACMNLISHGKLFQSQSSVWSFELTNAGKKPVSIMEQLLSLSLTDKEARRVFTNRIESCSVDAESILTARFLKAMLNLLIAVDAGEPEEVIDLAGVQMKLILDQIQPPRRDTNQVGASNNQKIVFSQSFLRQAAQIVEATPGIPSKLERLHEMFAVCPLHVNLRTKTFDDTILPTMLQAYRNAGQIERSVDRLLAADQQTSDVSEMGSSQTLWDNHLRRKLWIAGALLEMGAVFESLAICRRELDDNVRITASEKLNQGETPNRLRVLEAKTSDRITPNAARLFLQRLIKRIETSDSKTLAVDLIMSPATAFRTDESLPIFLLAAQQAATNKQGQKQLAALNRIFEEPTAAFLDPSAAIGARLTIACVLNSVEVATLSQRYIESLNPQSKPSTLGVADDVRNSLAVLTAISACEQDQARQAFGTIRQATVSQVRRQQDFEAALILSGRFGQTETLIDAHIAQPGQNSVNQLQASRKLYEILQHAFSTATHGQMQASTRAFTLALADQPTDFHRWLPNSIDQTVKQTAQSRVAVHNHRKLKTQIHESIRRVLLTYEAQCGVDKREQIESQSDALQGSIAEWRNLTVGALQNIVFDVDNPTGYHLYEKEIAPAVGRNMQGVNFTKDGFEVPVSASQTLVRIAASCDRLNELSDRIQGDSVEAATLRIQMARQQSDPKQLVQRLKEFQERIAKDLTKLTAQSQQTSATTNLATSTPSNRQTSTQQAAAQQILDQQSAVKSRMVNQILHAVWAISLTETKDATEGRSDAQQIADELLFQANSVIESDDFTADRLSRISRIIQNQVKANASKTE